MKNIPMLLASFVYSATLSAQFKNNDTARIVNSVNANNHHQQELNTTNMKKVLILGMNPYSIDFTNPELPPGLSIEVIEKGTDATLEKLISMGYDTELFLIETGATDLSDLANQLKEKSYAGIVVGNGIRSIRANFILFEQIINVVHTFAPESKIIFNSLPADTDKAVQRWLAPNR